MAPFPTPVLVTGGNGFIGSHLVRRFVSEGIDTHVLIRKNSSVWRIREVLPQTKVWTGDLRDIDSIEQAVRGSAARVIFHAAGQTSGQRWSHDLRELHTSMEANIAGTLNLVRVAHNSGPHVRILIRAGGLAEYGDGPLPFDEDQRESPVSAYASSQVATTMFLHALRGHVHFPVVTLRLASVYGPARSIDFFLPSLIVHCLEGKIFRMTPGEQKWDMVYIDDVVDAFIKAAQTDLSPGEIINIGSGTCYRLIDIAKMIVQRIGSDNTLAIGQLAERSDETGSRYCRSDKARRLLGWSARTVLGAGIDSTIRWYKDHLSEVKLNSLQTTTTVPI